MKIDFKNKAQHILEKNLTDEKQVELIQELIQNYVTENQISSTSVSLDCLLESTISQFQSDDFSNNTIPTGFKNFDKEFSGFGLGELVLFGGRPAMGKTQLFINLALNMSKHAPVCFYSLDASSFQISNLFIASLTKIYTGKLITNKLTEDEKYTLKKIDLNQFKDRIFINEVSNNSITALKQNCVQMVEEHNVQIVFIDYIQLLSNLRYKSNRENEISSIIRELKNLARELNICIVVASQLSRAVEHRGGDKRPILSDLRESGSLEQDADKVIFLYRPEYYGFTEDEYGNSNRQRLELIVEKNKFGYLGSAHLKFENEYSRISDFEPFPDSFQIDDEQLKNLE